MNQKLSWGLFLGGCCLALVGISHTLASHSSWSTLATPPAVGELLADLAAAGITVLGALGINLKSST